MKFSLLITVYLIGIMSIFFGGYTLAGQIPNDRLNRAYQQSHQSGGGSGDPYSSDIEADDMFNTNINLTGGFSDSVFVRFARWLMRIGVMLGIPLLIYMGIKIMFALGDKAKLQTYLKELGYLLLGLILLLSSVLLVFLIASIMRGSLGNF